MLKLSPYIIVLFIGSLLSACDKTPTDPLVVIEPTEEVDFVFASDESGIIEIWKQEDGMRSKMSDNSDRNSWWPQANPQNDSILYLTSPFGEDLQDVKNTELRILDLETNDDILIINEGKHGWHATAWAQWSEDGKSIVLCYKKGPDSKWQLALVDTDGNNIQPVSTRSNYDYFDPVFSKDMTSVYCSVVPDSESPESENFEIHQIDLASGTETRLTYNSYRDQHPDLNPSGTKLIYESLVDPQYLSIGKWTTHIIDLATNKSEPILEEDQLNFQAKFIDDEQIVFVRLDILQLNTEFHTMRLRDGSIAPLLTENFNAINIDPLP